jgi:hypothetical protein
MEAFAKGYSSLIRIFLTDATHYSKLEEISA